MHGYDEALRLRIQDQDWSDDISRRKGDSSCGSPAVVAKTATKVTYPTSAAKFYYCQAESVFGTESEGGSGSLSGLSSAFFYALNLGSSIPPSGTSVLCTFVGNRWVFRYDGT